MIDRSRVAAVLAAACASTTGFSDPPLYAAAFTSAGGKALVSQARPGNDFIDVDLGPDGTPWAAFYADCPASGDTYCDATRGAIPPEGNGIAGWQAAMVAHLQWRP